MALVCACAALALARAQEAVVKPETFLLVPEPRAMRTARSITPIGAERTVLSPARETAQSPFLEVYPEEAFKAIGISPETFAERAGSVADRLLKDMQPEWVRDEQGQVIYAVFRGERPIYASLVVAPSLPRLFEAAFGPEIWLAAPDRRSLFVFPAKAATLTDFTADLLERYESDPYAASCEIFSWKRGQRQPVVVGSFGG